MPTLLNQRFPYLRIYDPQNERMVQFQGGRLDIEPDDPSFGVVMAHASRDPSIRVIDTVATPEAGPVNVVVKEATVNACDVCVPAIAFPNEQQYALHMKLVHSENEDEEPVRTRPSRRKAG